MKKNIVKGSIAQNISAQLHLKLAWRKAIGAPREAICKQRLMLQPQPVQIWNASEQIRPSHILAEMDDEAMSQLVADLCAAYEEACAIGDEATVKIIREALKIVGRYLAAGIGPKAAGVPTN